MAWRAASPTSLWLWLVKNGPPPTSTAPAPAWTICENAASSSRSLAAFSTKICRPSARPAPSMADNSVANFGSIRTAMIAALGTISHSSSIGFVPRWPLAKNTTSVTLPLGRLRLATRPVLTGSSPVTKIIGMVSVAVLATSAAGVLPTITATWRRTSSVAKPGSRSSWLSAQRYSIATFWPSTKPSSFRPCWNAATKCMNPADGVLRRKPITGIAGCCARAASGHAAAAPPSSVRNSRRFNSNCIRSACQLEPIFRISNWQGSSQEVSAACQTDRSHAVSGAVGQPGDGNEQDRAQRQADHAEGREHKDLPALQARTLGIIEERGELLVDRNHRQQLRQAGAKAPNGSLMPRRRNGPPEQCRAGEPERDHPGKNDEGMGAYAIAGHGAERGLQQAGSPQPRILARGLALALAAEIADVTGGVAVA